MLAQWTAFANLEMFSKDNKNRFTEKYLEMVIEVNLTVMLVLATL